MRADSTDGYNYFLVTNGVSQRTREPFVGVTVGEVDFHTTMPPEDAIALAHSLLAAAEAAMTDAFVLGWLRNLLGDEDKEAVGMLLEFREWREARARDVRPTGVTRGLPE